MRKPVRASTLWALCAVSAGATLGLIDPPEAQIRGRGFDPGKLYDVESIDSVNLFSGGLTIAIPLGPEYPVGGGFSYQLMLAYNSYVWDREELVGAQCPPMVQECIKVSATPVSNAGLGWTLQLGTLFPPDTPPVNDDEDLWLYLGPDGGRHLFYDTLHEEELPDPDPGVWYSRDGTYLRLTFQGGTPDRYLLDTPSGVRHTFELRQGRWRLKRMEDRFGNFLEVTFVNGPPARWDLTDSHGRVHKITFQDPPVGSEITERQVDKVEVAAFGGTTALYDLSYEDTAIERPFDDSAGSPANAFVPLLTEIDLPEGNDFSMWDGMTPYYHTTFPASGRIQKIQLPTLGYLAWTWGTWSTPKDREASPGNVLPWSLTSGVLSRALLDTDGSTQIGQARQYENGTYPEDAGFRRFGTARSDYRNEDFNEPSYGPRTLGEIPSRSSTILGEGTKGLARCGRRGARP